MRVDKQRDKQEGCPVEHPSAFVKAWTIERCNQFRLTCSGYG